MKMVENWEYNASNANDVQRWTEIISTDDVNLMKNLWCKKIDVFSSENSSFIIMYKYKQN